MLSISIGPLALPVPALSLLLALWLGLAVFVGIAAHYALG